MAGDLIDPDTAAGVAEAVMDRAVALASQLVTLGQAVTASAEGAAGSAAAAAATQAAITAMLKTVGVTTRWSGTALSILLPDGSYSTPVDLQGVEGPPGETPTFHVGQVTTGPVSIDIHDEDPLNPIVDFVIPAGANGWTPVPAIVADGTRCVVRVVDWTGGTGPKPSVGQFVGPAGFVAAASAGTDLRGLPGPGAVNHTGSPNPGDIAVFGIDGDHIGSGGALTAFGASLVAALDRAAAKALLQIVIGDVSGAAPLVSPAFTGAPTTQTTPAAGDSSLKLANTAFVANAIAALVGGAPAILDTFAEVAAQLQNDESVVSALMTTVSGKLAKASNLSDLANPATARTNLGVAIGSNVQQWDADLDAIATLSTTAYGRGLLTLASAVALTAAINAFAGDAGSGGTKGLVPAPAAGDAAAGKLLRADGTWATPAASSGNSGAPSAYNTRALPYPATAADKGTAINPTGTGALSLPAATAVSGWFAWIKKRDEGGTATITPASGTIDGLASIVAYKEEFLVYYDAVASTAAGSPVYRTQGRQRGWIDFGSFSVSANTVSVSLTAGVNDPEIEDLQIDVEKFVPSSSDFLRINFLIAGSVSNFTGHNLYTSSTSVITAAATALTLGASSSVGPTGGLIDIRNIRSSGVSQSVRGSTQAGDTSTIASVFGNFTSVGACTGVQLICYNGSNITSMLYNVRLYRP